jgi:hypothetical protein
VGRAVKPGNGSHSSNCFSALAMAARAALGPAAAAVAALLSGPASGEDFGGLPEGEGRKLLYYACTGCHSLMIIQQQEFSRRVWSEVLEWMVEAQGMALLPPEDGAILARLSGRALRHGP